MCVPVSKTGGQVRTSTAAEASFDLSSLQMSCVVMTHTERLTCKIQQTACLNQCKNTQPHIISVLSTCVPLNFPQTVQTFIKVKLNLTACEIYSRATAAPTSSFPSCQLPFKMNKPCHYSQLTFINFLIFPECWLVSRYMQAAVSFAPSIHLSFVFTLFVYL